LEISARARRLGKRPAAVGTEVRCRADTSSAPIFAALRRLLRRFGIVLFGIGAIREKAQRRLVQPRRDAVGCWPHLPIINNGPVKCRLLGPAAEVFPRSDAARWRFVLYPAPDFPSREGPAGRALTKVGGVSKVRIGRAYHRSVLARFY
jgi:hypothetical protein